jgi:hypothetical protein
VIVLRQNPELVLCKISVEPFSHKVHTQNIGELSSGHSIYRSSLSPVLLGLAAAAALATT